MKRILILSFICLFAIPKLRAQLKMSGVPVAEEVTLHSEINGEDYHLKITLPYPYKPKKNKYPVLFYLDAFTTASGMNELAKLKMLGKDYEQMILVGISYETYPFLYGKKRERDYMPPLDAKDKDHEGDQFLTFIKSELIPYVEKEYSTDSNDRGLMGYSLGGLFTTWAFMQEPELFNRLAIISPSLWYGGNDFILKNQALKDNIANVQNLKVFISYGSEEGEDFKKLGAELYALFKANKKCSVDLVIFEDEDHGSVWAAASNRAMYSLYPDPFKGILRKANKLYGAKEYQAALNLYQTIMQDFPEEVDDGNYYDMACLEALLGNADAAFEILNKLDEDYRDWPEKMMRDSDLISLHSDPRWEALLASLKD